VSGVDLDWCVDVIDPGCDCCSFVGVAAFATEAQAKKFVRGTGQPSNYSIQYMGDDE
jgi:hypothetical protein